MERSCPSTLLPNLTNSGADIIRIGRDFDAVTYRFRTRTGAVLTLEPPPAILPDNVAGSVQILELMGFDLRDSRIADAISTLHLAGRRCRIPWAMSSSAGRRAQSRISGRGVI